MKQILLFGAGKSATVLIAYLLDHAAENNWHLTIADNNMAEAMSKLKGHAHGSAVMFDANEEGFREDLISKADLVISMLPASMHVPVAKDCIKHSKHLITASYVSPEMAALNDEAKAKGIVLLNEMGLDPGIDHMSAMQLIHKIKNEGGTITSFKSNTGGLIAPESMNNPWGYKFTWNPRNVILAGKGTARYLHGGKLKFIPYERLFTQTETVEIEGIGTLEGYANRDSLHYIEEYGLEGIDTMLRGTLRYKNYCHAWNCFIKLGLTDESFVVPHSEDMTYADIVESLLPEGYDFSEESIVRFLGLENYPGIFQMIKWTGILSNEKIGVTNATPAQTLLHLLEEKWKLNHGDLDLVVMVHEFIYTLNKQQKKVTSTLVLKGEDEFTTAMAKTVGLPMAIAAKLILTGKLMLSGVVIPTVENVYTPVLAELAGLGIVFTEHEEIL